MAETLLTLALLACPVGMGLMMWFMMRGSKSAPPAATEHNGGSAEVVALRAELDQLQAQMRETGSAPAAASPPHQDRDTSAGPRSPTHPRPGRPHG